MNFSKLHSRQSAASVKAAVDLVALIERYLPLKRAGHNMVGLCPFHAEKTPSFTVNPERQLFTCFGCGKAGDAFSFVMEREGLDFRGALEFLAARARISRDSRHHGLNHTRRVQSARVEPQPPDLRPIVEAAIAHTDEPWLRLIAEDLGLPMPAGVEALRRLHTHLPWYRADEILKIAPRSADDARVLRGQCDSLARTDWIAAWPMTDRTAAWRPMHPGRVVGVRTRNFRTKEKRALVGSREGLLVPTGIANCLDTLAVCEGPTDTLAMLSLGIDAIGRPSCRGAVDETVVTVGGLHASHVVVVLDRDEAGIRGGVDFAVLLSRSLSRSVRLVIPPAPHKDVRAWIAAGATRSDLIDAIERSRCVGGGRG